MKSKKIIFIVLAILGIAITFLLYQKELITYAIITGALSLVFIVLFFMGPSEGKNPEDRYNNYIKEIMKTFDAILVNTDELPEVDGRSIVLVPDFEDLVDAQIEIRKPIYYKKDLRSSIYILLDDKQACITVLKVDKDENSMFDLYIQEQKNKKNKFDQNILTGIENTTIVKLDNNKSYKISPVRNDEVKQVKQPKEIKKTIDRLPKLKDTMDLSKTQIFKELNKRRVKEQ